MKDYNFFNKEQSKMFSLFGRTRGGFHFNCIALINEQCRDNHGCVLKDSIILEIENEYGSEVNVRLELMALADSGWIELFQKPHLISDFVRMTKNGKILFHAIEDIHGNGRDFSYGKYISDIYRRLITVDDISNSSYQDILLSSYEDTMNLKEYMQNFRSSFEDFVKSQKANVKSAGEVIHIMKAVRDGKEFRNYKAIVKDEFNYFRYSNGICSQIDKIKAIEAVSERLIHSCMEYESASDLEAKEKVMSILYDIKTFFSEEYKQLVEMMKETENECYEKIANTLTLYAKEDNENKSFTDLFIKCLHDAQEGGKRIPDQFYLCFGIYDNRIFEKSSLSKKRKDPEYKFEEPTEFLELNTIDKLNILIQAHDKIKMKTSNQELVKFLSPYCEKSATICSKDLNLRSGRDYANVFMTIMSCQNPSFEYDLIEITNEIINKGSYKIPYFVIRRKGEKDEDRIM